MKARGAQEADAVERVPDIVRRTHWAMEVLRGGGYVTRHKIQKKFGVSQDTAARDLRILRSLYGLEIVLDGCTKVYIADPGTDLTVSSSGDA